MKYVFILLLIKSSLCIGQNKVDLNQLQNLWNKFGNIDNTGNIIKEDKELRSSAAFRINDSIVTYGVTVGWCGNSGYQKSGKWSVSKLDTTLTFYFTELFDNEHGKFVDDFEETQNFKIIKLENEELILRELFTTDRKTILFKRKTDE